MQNTAPCDAFGSSNSTLNIRFYYEDGSPNPRCQLVNQESGAARRRRRCPVSTQSGGLTGEAKAALAEELTAFHRACAGVPRNWVHVIFQEYAPGNGYTAGKAAAAAALTLLIRTSRSVEYKGDSSSAYGNSCRAPHAPPDDQIVIGIHEVPPSPAMEMGQIMPEVETS